MGANESRMAEDAFHDRLRDLVTEAAAEGIEVEGDWPILTDDPGTRDWDLEIVRLAPDRE